MKLRTAPDGLLAWDEADRRWVVLRAAAERYGRGEPVPPDVVTLLASGEKLQARTRALLDACRGDASVTSDPARASIRLALLAVGDQAKPEHTDRHHRHDYDQYEEAGEARAKAHGIRSPCRAYRPIAWLP